VKDPIEGARTLGLVTILLTWTIAVLAWRAVETPTAITELTVMYLTRWAAAADPGASDLETFFLDDVYRLESNEHGERWVCGRPVDTEVTWFLDPDGATNDGSDGADGVGPSEVTIVDEAPVQQAVVEEEEEAEVVFIEEGENGCQWEERLVISPFVPASSPPPSDASVALFVTRTAIRFGVEVKGTGADTQLALLADALLRSDTALPDIPLHFDLDIALWLGLGIVLMLAIEIRMRLAAAVRAPLEDKTAWVLLDGREGLEAVLALGWWVALCVAPFLALGSVVLAESAFLELGLWTVSQALSALRATGIVVAALVGVVVSRDIAGLIGKLRGARAAARPPAG
jgi:hypothetical protein